MGKDTCLLEHTLVMAGDEIEDGATCQGWPADAFTEARIKIGDIETEEGRGERQKMEGTSEFNGREWFGIEVRRWFRRDGCSRRYERISGTSEEGFF